ncbi:MAG TPA: PQQ-binding-like beta-propeller repeat protein [Gemmataceae bacterium]|nr:PQQ-binding-like beta-propeller repeat protein [Gemmataceae bacterium]
MSDIARRDDVTSHVPTAPPPDAVASAAPARPALGWPRPRVWPGVVIVALMWAATTVPAWVVPGSMFQFQAMFLGPQIAAGLFLLWWLLFSRTRWTDRLLLPLACAAFGTVATLLFHTEFMVRFYSAAMYGAPTAMTAWVVWLLLTPFLSWPTRRAGLLVVLFLAWAWMPLVRIDGIDGSLSATLAWRWSPTAEERFLANRPTNVDLPAEVLTLRPGDWPAFRGPNRDNRLTGVRVATDWKAKKPLWKRDVGPGWGAFAVVGDRLFTQEQRGKDEAVVCYQVGTGDQVWEHTDEARFSEIVAGPGPRATPTFHEGKLYTLGAAGRLNCLDAATGKVIWTHDIVADSGAKVPTWGFASSPLVAKGIVSVFAGGPDGKSVLGYKAATGELAWAAGEGQLSYCSPQLSRLGGVEQVLIVTDAGLTAFDPVKGDVLWKHDWKVEGGARVCQPAVLGDSDVLLGTPMQMGTRRLHVSRTDSSGWEAKEVWTTQAIKPYYNDLVIHDGHLYGFDGIFFTCVSLEDGAKKWRERGYGNGQVLLLADQGLLLVTSEKGEVALVEASPAGHKQLGKFQALKGKTWNHPVVAHGKLFVRNGAEMACFELVGE